MELALPPRPGLVAEHVRGPRALLEERRRRGGLGHGGGEFFLGSSRREEGGFYYKGGVFYSRRRNWNWNGDCLLAQKLKAVGPWLGVVEEKGMRWGQAVP